jgi:phospholipid/cholesterol/gamma-HCH transport system permease protein
MTPLLTIYANVWGLVGGAVVFLSSGYPFVTYSQQVMTAISLSTLLGGLAKTLVFGFVVGGVGCLRGLETLRGASAVGVSTTRAVVAGIFLIILADCVFSVAYYFLGI